MKCLHPPLTPRKTAARQISCFRNDCWRKTRGNGERVQGYAKMKLQRVAARWIKATPASICMSA